MHKRSIVIALGLFAMVGGLVGYLSSGTSEAQRNTTLRYEYAVIQGSYRPYPYSDASTVAGAVNICYLQQAGCGNVEVKAEVILTKFAQDERLDNARDVSDRAYGRAIQNAFSKAIAKLGAEGWQMIDKPQIEFDLYYESGQASKSVIQGQQTARQHIWFARERQ